MDKVAQLVGLYIFIFHKMYIYIVSFTATTSLFLLILKIRLDKMPNWTVAIVTQISRVSLPLYLISWITDHIVYSILRENVTLFKQQMLYMPVVVLSSFVLAFILAIFINQVCRIKRCCSS